MAQSLFDWDDDEEEKADENVALIRFQPDPFAFEQEKVDDRRQVPDDEGDPLELYPQSIEHRFDPFTGAPDNVAPPPTDPLSYSDPAHETPEPFQFQRDSSDSRSALFQFKPGPSEPQQEQQGYLRDPSDLTTGPLGDLDEIVREHADQAETVDFLPEPFEPQPISVEEGSRRSGLAFSAGIVFFSSVVFMLFLGWIADLLVGSSPWGLVGGIVLGSIIGFIQFFRITSQIFNTKKSESAMRPLLMDDDETP